MTKYEDSQGNIVGPGYEIDPEGDLVFFVSPSAMGYGSKEPKPAAGEPEDAEDRESH